MTVVLTDEEKRTEKAGYVFDQDNPKNVLTGTIAGDGSLVLKVYFKQQFTVTYAPGDHGTFEEQKTEAIDYGVATPAAPTKEDITGDAGYTFTGWDKEIADKVTGNVTYTAQWTANENTRYTVEYYYQAEGKYTDPEADLREGTTDAAVKVTDEDKNPTKSGYVLDHNADNVLEGTVKGDGSLVLKVYFKQQFTVKYAPGDHGNFEEQKTEAIDYGAATPAAPTKEDITGDAGYTFTGWDKEIADKVTGNVTYTAQWTANENTRYTVEYYYQAEGKYTDPEADLREGTTDAAVKVTDEDKNPTKSGYVLDHNADNVLEGTVKGDGSLVLKVYFKQQFTVKYAPGDHGNFEEQKTEAIDYGAATPAAPAKEDIMGDAGYTFTGWSPTLVDTVTENRTYVAQWEARTDLEYTVKYLEKDTDKELAEADTVGNQTLGATATAKAKNIAGYRVVGESKQTITIEASENVITFYYEKDNDQTQPTEYTVQHVIGDKVQDTAKYTATAWINDQNPMIEIQEGSVDAKSYTGYKFASISPEVTAGDKVTSGDTITLTYVKDDQVTKTLDYTVRYVVGGIERTELTNKYTKPVWINEKDNTLEIQEGSIDKKEFDGYKFEKITDDVKVGDKVADKTTITLNYVADFSDLEAEGFERPYNGTASSVSITGTIAGDKIEFLTNARTTDSSFTAVNVGDSAEKLTVKVTRGNESWTKDVKAVITPLDVTLKSADLIKMYDGSALTNGDAALETEDGFITGEGAEYTFTGSRTEVGSSENTFTYELKEGTLAENYNITAEPGTLTITPASDNPIVTPGGNDAPPVTPATVIRVMTGAPPAVANFIGGALQSAGARVSELVVSEDDEVPLANMKSEHRCCIFHFLLMLIALILLALYTRNMKKRQEELFELRRQIDEERAAQGLPPAGEDQWVRK